MAGDLFEDVEFVSKYFAEHHLAAVGTPLRERLEELALGGVIHAADLTPDPAILDMIQRALKQPEVMINLERAMAVVMREERRLAQIAAAQLPPNTHPFDDKTPEELLEAECRTLAFKLCKTGYAHVWNQRRPQRTTSPGLSDWNAVAMEFDVTGGRGPQDIVPMPIAHGRGDTEFEAWQDLRDELAWRRP